MKVLCQLFFLTILSVSVVAPGSGEAVEETPKAAPAVDCAVVAKQMLQAIQANPDQWEKLFEQSILKSKDCACELLTAAIKASDGGAQTVKLLVVIALKHAGEQASAIAECAVIAAPMQLEAIREAFAEVQLKPASKKPSLGKPKAGAMVKDLVPGLEPKPKPDSKPALKPDSPVVAGGGTASKAAFRNRPPGKEVLARGQQALGAESDKAGATEAEITGFASSLNQFEFDYLWPEMQTSDEAEQLVDAAGWHAYVGNGFDSNVNTAPGDAAVDSYFVGGGGGTYYALVTRETRFDVRARFGVRYDENAPPELRNIIYQGRLLARLEHQVLERLRVSDQVGVSYDAEPDFLSGETTGFREGQYVFAYNRLAFGYRWAKHFETRTYYTVSTIQYEDERLRVQEDRWRHLLGQQFRVRLNDKQAAFLEYRYGQTDFQMAPNDSQSHYFVGGVDYEISPGVKGMALAGVEKRDFERFLNQWQPYAEASFQSQWSDRTRVRWGARLGFEDAEIGGFRDRYGFRTGLAIDQDLSDRLMASLGLFYLHSDFDSGGQDLNGYTDEAVMLQLALSYALLENLDLYLGYGFTRYDSGDPLRNYERHRVRLGLNSSF